MNEAFVTKKEELEAKYKTQIDGLSRVNNVDLGVAFDLLLSNVERDTTYVGGGRMTTEAWAELVQDVADLRALGRG